MNNGYSPYQQQQQQPQQPMYQKPPSLIDRIYGRKTDTLQSLLSIVSLILFIIAPIIFLYCFIMGIVVASNANRQEFALFLNYFFDGVYKTAIFIALGMILAAFKRIISK
ncbi:MAG: hypothetical protein PHD46_04845 [Eubacteriales bacterium]|nr:hypothetical protein [Eubacteriales bacterium]MDD4422345.1 hypothetical protein [Eubacteriales bacterium]HBR32362.1 hypothetical protein [Clostridiales bacterium]